MKKHRNISDEWRLPEKGHENFNFVDIALNDDNLLFIDPCLIEARRNAWSIKAADIMESYFDNLFSAYEANDKGRVSELLSHAGEQNCTRLGYGNGENGKGNTANGLQDIFRPLERMIHEIKTIGRAMDLPVLISGFAEDGMSDLLTNILHEQLNQFTLEEMRKHGIQSNGENTFYAWDRENKSWKKIKKPGYFFLGKEVLLVPKSIVRKNYLFGVEQYFSRIILERMIDEGGYRDANGKAIPKKAIVKAKRYTAEHWQYDEAVGYSKEHNDALEEYHLKIPGFYMENGLSMSDEELDETVYGYVISQSA